MDSAIAELDECPSTSTIAELDECPPSDSTIAELDECTSRVLPLPELATSKPKLQTPPGNQIIVDTKKQYPEQYRKLVRLYRHSLSYPFDKPTLDSLPIKFQYEEDEEQFYTCLCRRTIGNDDIKYSRSLSHPVDQDTLFAKLDDHDEKRFYATENQKLLRKKGKKPEICLLCTYPKVCQADVVDRNPPKSHIFPNSLIQAYGRFHYDSMTKGYSRFIYDVAAGMRGHNQLSCPLFCDQCEKINNTTGSKKGRKEETFLKGVYYQVMSADPTNHMMITKECSHELRHILAIILFRGALMNINFLKEWQELYFEEFFKLFIELRDYCRETDLDIYSKMPMAEKIHLFLVPNTPFFPCTNLGQNLGQGFIIDLLLRNPEFTTIVQLPNKPKFLFTKFDCFHCVLPFSGGIEFLSKKGSCFTGGEDEDHFILHRPMDAMKDYPDKLLVYITQTAPHVCESLLHTTPAKFITHLHKNDKPKLYERQQSSVAEENDQEQKTIIKDLSKGFKTNLLYYEKLEKEAKLKSPLRLIDSTVASKDKAVASKDEEISTLRSQVASKDKEISTLKSQVASKDEEIATLQTALANLKASHQKEITKYKEENAEYKDILKGQVQLSTPSTDLPLTTKPVAVSSTQ